MLPLAKNQLLQEESYGHHDLCCQSIALNTLQFTLQIHACLEAEQHTSIRKGCLRGKGIVASTDERCKENVVGNDLIYSRFQLMVILESLAENDLRPAAKLIDI